MKNVTITKKTSNFPEEPDSVHIAFDDVNIYVNIPWGHSVDEVDIHGGSEGNWKVKIEDNE